LQAPSAVDRFAFARYRDGVAKYLSAIDETATFNAINSDWSDRPPLLQLREEDRLRGADALRTLGVPAGARFVCLHTRDGGYSPSDEHYHSFRNAPTRPISRRSQHCTRAACTAFEWATQPCRGCRRPLAASITRILPAAEWLDVFLCAQCQFFVATRRAVPDLNGLWSAQRAR